MNETTISNTYKFLKKKYDFNDQIRICRLKDQVCDFGGEKKACLHDNESEN